MSDDDLPEGLSGAAWYQLGRMSVQNEALLDHQVAVVHEIFRTRTTGIDAAAELHKANANIEKWMAYCTQLKDVIRAKDEKIAELSSASEALQDQLDLALNCYEAVSSDSHERQLRIETLEHELGQLRKGSS